MIDWNRVRALRDEVGPEDFEEVVELFLEEVDSEISELDDKAPNFGEKLHFLKGSALSLGFRQFSSLCQQGESGLAQGSGTEIDVSALHACYQASRNDFLENLGSETGG
ncbi:Hpt domain-containing protein [uncultured Roseobacter sp.]|uniref:Hpt domain-containing protein n=1 Tax=uncultured Roseobacter sp. TaxID=114847 RepID=UPI002624D106|nr:Hpt domain-containing protein [uncultured Roseobacter sp.]